MIETEVDRRGFLKRALVGIVTVPTALRAAGVSLLLSTISCKDSSRSPSTQTGALWKVSPGTNVARATELTLGDDPTTGTPNVGYRGNEVIRIGGKEAHKDPSGTNMGDDEGFHFYVDGTLHLSSPSSFKLSSGTHTISWVFVDRFDREVGGPVVAFTVEVA